MNFDGVSLAACSDPYLLTDWLKFCDSVVRRRDAAAAASSKLAVAVLTLCRLRSRSCLSSVTSLEMLEVPVKMVPLKFTQQIAKRLIIF